MKHTAFKFYVMPCSRTVETKPAMTASVGTSEPMIWDLLEGMITRPFADTDEKRNFRKPN
jgi:hypothetical protein